MSFFNVIKHLLPRSNSWSLTIDKTLRKWFQGIAEWPQDVKDFVDLVWLDAFPATTRELSAWEKQFGLQTRATLPLFAAVSNDGTSRVMTSPYGETWTARTASELSSWTSVAWSPSLGIFCAVAQSGTNQVMTSPDGTTWTSRTAAGGGAWQSVTWSPSLGIFCAVAQSGTDRVMTSPDGINWTARTASEANQWKSVTWSPSLGIFCAVASTGTNQVMTSPDGITWTSQSEPEANTWTSVVWNEKIGLFASVSTGGTNRAMTSTDGITWTARLLDLNVWTSVASSEFLGRFCAVAVSGGGTDKVVTSDDGITWTTRTAISESWDHVTFGESARLFCAVASAGTNQIMTSPDGITWTAQSEPEANSWTSITFADLSNDDARRDALERAWVPSTGQSPKRIQDELQANGFDVYVFDAFYWANELTDGDMEAAGTTAWTAINATLSKQTTSPYEGTQLMRVAETTQINYSMRQTGLMTAGHKYWVKGVVRSDGTGIPVVQTLGGTVVYTGTTSTSWQHFLFQLNNDDIAGDLTVDFGGTGENTYVEYDALEIFDLNLTLYRDPTDVIGPSVSGNPLFYKVPRTAEIYTVEAGDDSVYSGENQEAGETHMEAGNYSGFRSLFDPYPIPTDSTKFPHFLYIGSEGFTAIDIDETRRGELEDLCLKLCPTEKWIGFIEDTVDVWVYLEIITGSSSEAKIAALLGHLQATYGKGDTITNADNITWMDDQYPADEYGQWAVATSAPVEPPSAAPGPDSLVMASGETPVFATARVKLIATS